MWAWPSPQLSAVAGQYWTSGEWRKLRSQGVDVDRVKEMECLTIYNDKQLWLAFKFFHKHGKETRIEIAPELERNLAMCLRSNSLQYFRKDLPYIPNPASPIYDTYIGRVNVVDIDWDYYYGG